MPPSRPKRPTKAESRLLGERTAAPNPTHAAEEQDQLNEVSGKRSGTRARDYASPKDPVEDMKRLLETSLLETGVW